jgi:hypothetical protein
VRCLGFFWLSTFLLFLNNKTKTGWAIFSCEALGLRPHVELGEWRANGASNSDGCWNDHIGNEHIYPLWSSWRLCRTI